MKALAISVNFTILSKLLRICEDLVYNIHVYCTVIQTCVISIYSFLFLIHCQWIPSFYFATC